MTDEQRMEEFRAFQKDRDMRRYAHLVGYSARNDEEEREVWELGVRFKLEGRDPGWDIVPRNPKHAPGGEHYRPMDLS